MSALKKLWKDKMDIYRYVEITVSNVTKSKEDKIHSNEPCHYSKKSLGNSGEEGIPILESTHTLFCGLDTDIIEGDRVIITKPNGKVFTFKVGEGFPYTTHMEFSLKRDDTA